MIAAHLSLPLNCNAIPRAINGMLRSTHGGVLRAFGNWHKNKEANFNKLRVKGVLRASSEQNNGALTFLKITNKKGRTCIVENPCPAKEARDKGGMLLESKTLTFKTDSPSKTILQLQ